MLHFLPLAAPCKFQRNGHFLSDHLDLVSVVDDGPDGSDEEPPCVHVSGQSPCSSSHLGVESRSHSWPLDLL